MSNISKKAVKRLASGSMKLNKGKYSVMTFSVILTTVLFSSFFTILGSVLSELRDSSMGQYNYLDPTAFLICVAALVIFIFSGYLIIYNIFDLNVVADMKEYGLLKTIGTSGKQIRSMVKHRARYICLFAIPIGLVIGCGAGGRLLPMIGRFINTACVNKGHVHMSIWIILFTVLFAYFTVAISSGKPCRRLSRISPVEAARYTGRVKKNGKAVSRRIPLVLSLTLSLVVLNSAYTIMSSFSTETFAEEYTVADFCVQDALLDNAGAKEKNVNAIDSTFLTELSMQEAAQKVGNLYLTHEDHVFSSEVWSGIEKRFFSDETVKMQIESFYTDEGYSVNAYLKEMHNKRTMEGNTYGISEPVAGKLEDVLTMDGTADIDWGKFNSGRYVIAERWQYASDGFLDIVCPGDKVEIRGREYTVYALADIPMLIEYPVYASIECSLILPEDEYLAVYGECKPMRTLIDVEDKKESSFEEWISSYTRNTSLSYTSKQSVTEDNKAFGDLFAIAGILVAVILGIIGVMNFGNTMIASVISRSHELAVLEAVGMTVRQQKRSLIREGLEFFTYTSVFAVLLSGIINVTAVKTLVDNLPMFSWKFSLTALAICLPVILVIILMIPAAAYKRISKRSVVERLRTE
ncbi:MAG: ABC transporter permease [Lachnospiraceae bacterium]|nr:ABC transporter permease [Lachnospiraceae bacterium]